jgi:hypothetical protein
MTLRLSRRVGLAVAHRARDDKLSLARRFDRRRTPINSYSIIYKIVNNSFLHYLSSCLRIREGDQASP